MSWTGCEKHEIDRGSPNWLDNSCCHDCYESLQAELDKHRELLKELKQQVEDTIAVAVTEDDEDGFIKAYHFKTGAIHRLLAMSRKSITPPEE